MLVWLRLPRDHRELQVLLVLPAFAGAPGHRAD
jgi:hypothetical protein